jgi:Lamin Tail Domain
MNKTLFIALSLICSQTFAQLNDNFSDGDFITNPVWSGDLLDFIATDHLLRSNGPNAANSKLYLQTANTKINDVEWSFLIDLDFNPTSTTLVRVYLISNQTNLEGPLNGYYIQLGQTGDDFIKLFQQTGINSTEIFSGSTNLGAGNISVRVKVRRSSSGVWHVFSDATGGVNFVSEGASITNNTHIITSSFGVYCSYSTASRFNLYHFDDFYVGDIITDTTAPVIESVQAISSTKLALAFNEPLDASTAQNAANFNIDNSIGNPTAAVLSADQKTIELTFTTPFSDGVENHLTVSGVKDIAGNTITTSSQVFTFAVAEFGDIIINELFADPSPQVALPTQEFIEIYNKSNKTINLTGWGLSDLTTTATLPNVQLSPGEYVILTNMAGAAAYPALGKTVGLINFPSLNNDGDEIKLIDASGTLISQVHYRDTWYKDDTKADGGWSLECLDPQANVNDMLNWQVSENASGGTPGKQNSVFGKNPDATPPALLTLSVLNNAQLLLEFDEPINVSSQLPARYFVNALGNPSSVLVSSDEKSIHLIFTTPFGNGVTRSLAVTDIQDLAGNMMPDLQREFHYFVATPAKEKDVIITEIMADPSPVVQLPEAEYLELFNRTSNPFNLKDWKLSDATGSTMLPSFIILPDEYVILTSTTNASKFASNGKVYGVSNFPSLNNEGELVVLKNENGVLIDSVRYFKSWYKSNENADGGWSLELIDVQNTCGDENNWASSEAERGGTPGMQNSIFANKPDLTGPQLIEATAIESDKLLVRFNERLNKNIVNFSFELSPMVSIQQASFTDASLKAVQIKLVSSLRPRTSYIIKINQLYDCSGNSIQHDFSELTFALPESAAPSDLLINELLFNPKPGGVDFVEIYNQSLKYINLKNFKLGNVDGSEIKNKEIITLNDLILPPGNYLVFTENPTALKNNYPLGYEKNFVAVDMPGLPDDEGSIALMDAQNNRIDFFQYTKEYHSALIKDDEGVSLERTSFTNAGNTSANWKSATASSGYATPGYANSNAYPENLADDGEISIMPEIFSTTAGPNEFAKIQYRFEQNGYLANVKVYDQQGRFVKEISNNESIPMEGFFRWDGDRNDGSKARSGYYIVWFEIFNTEGTVKTYRKRVIVANLDQ